MNILTKIEAERVFHILKNATDQLEILSHVPLSSNEQYLLDLESNESVISALEKLWICEEGLSKIETTSIMFDSKDISLLRQTHKNIRHVCKAAIAYDNNHIIAHKPTTSSEEFLDFLRYLNELKMQTLIKLNTTVEDEEININSMHELGDKTRLLEETKRILDSKLTELNYQRERQYKDLDETKNKLVIELKDLSEMNTLDTELVEKEMNDAIIKATEDHDKRMKELLASYNTIKSSLYDLNDHNHDDELRYRKDKNKAELALNTKISEYNTVMSNRQEQLAEIQKNHEIELQEYNILKIYFDNIDAQLAQKAAEMKLLRIIQSREEYGNKFLFQTASKIQKIVRGRQARFMVMKLKVKKNGKNGGKKKEGKKKEGKKEKK